VLRKQTKPGPTQNSAKDAVEAPSISPNKPTRRKLKASIPFRIGVVEVGGFTHPLGHIPKKVPFHSHFY